MTFVRVYLLVVGTFSVVIGLAYMIRPVEMAAVADLELSSPTAIIDVQGFYGGPLVGPGAAMLRDIVKCCGRRSSSRRSRAESPQRNLQHPRTAHPAPRDGHAVRRLGV